MANEISKSYERCMKSGRFYERFYEIFVRSDPRIPRYFANTDMGRQKVLIREGMEILLMGGFGSIRAKAYLNKIGGIHDRAHVNVKPELYPVWMKCMIATLREHDPEFNDELEGSWRDHLQKGIDRMAALY